MTGAKRLVRNRQDADLAAAPDAAGRVTAWLARQLLAERERWVLWLPVAYGVGTAVYFWLPEEPSAIIGPLGIVVAMVAGYSLRHRGRLPILAIALGAVAIGFVMAQWHSAWIDAPVLVKRLGPTDVIGEVQRPLGVRQWGAVDHAPAGDHRARAGSDAGSGAAAGRQ